MADKKFLRFWTQAKAEFDRQKRVFYPAYHLAPAMGWMNDPNGLIYHNGLYHAFYQHYPYKAEWGPMHWGHATSADMVRWRHHPPALLPSAGPDQDGCFSGSAITAEGKLCLIYTGHSWAGEAGADGLRPFRQVQCLATSEDGFHFSKQGAVLESPEGISHFRDPKIWFEDGLYWLVLGVSNKRDCGEAWLYRGASLRDWQFDRVLARGAESSAGAAPSGAAGQEQVNAAAAGTMKASGGMGYMWECPDFFPLNGKHILSFSPQGIQATRGYRRRNLFQTGLLRGSWRPGEDFILETPFTELDNGHDYYAAQSFLAADGRRIVLAWMDMWEAEQPSAAEGWAGAFTLPRAVALDAEGRLRQMPIAELQILRGEKQELEQTALNNAALKVAENITAQEIMLRWDRKNAKAERYGLRLGRGLAIYMDTQSERLVLDRFYPDVHLCGSRSVGLQADDCLKLHIFFDNSSVEVFVNDGEAALTSRIYPAAADRAAFLFADAGAAALTGGEIWQLKPMQSEKEQTVPAESGGDDYEQSE